MKKDEDDGPGLDWAFANIPMLEGFDQADYAITPLPGYTNRNYRLHNAGQDWVLRLPRARSNRFIDRAAEAHNQASAHRLGLAPAVVWRNDIGVTLTRTLRASRHVRAADFDKDETLSLIVESLRRLHCCGLPFHGSEDLAGLLERHYALLDARRRLRLSPSMTRARRTLARLDSSERESVPSHRDLVLQNLLLDDRRLWLIDWEYSAMASPYWDLATLCNEAKLNPRQSARLLQLYCANGAPMKESLLFDYRELLELLNDCWMAALAG